MTHLMPKTSHIRSSFRILWGLAILCLAACKKGSSTNISRKPGNSESSDQVSATECNNIPFPVMLTEELIEQLQTPQYVLENIAEEATQEAKQKRRHEAEQRLSTVKEALKQVMQGTGDVNARLDIEEWDKPPLIQAVILLDPPTALLDALKNERVDLDFNHKGEHIQCSLIAGVALEAPYKSLRWLVENEGIFKPYPGDPPYQIVHNLWDNEHIDSEQWLEIVKALVKKGLDVGARTDQGTTLLHSICLQPDTDMEEKYKIYMVGWLFLVDEHINISQSLHMEDQHKMVPWELAYYHDNNDLAAALIEKMTGREARQKTLKKGESTESASGSSHIKRFEERDPKTNGYEKIKAAFESIQDKKKADR